MIKFKRILKDYEQSGALNALVNIHAAVDGNVFLTKSGDLVTLLALRGVDPECLDHSQKDHIARRFESALRLFDERFRVYQYLLKRESAPLPHEHNANPVVEEAIANRIEYLRTKGSTIYSIEAYVAVVYEDWMPAQDLAGKFRHFATHPKAAWRQAFSMEHSSADLAREIDRAREILTGKVTSFILQLRDAIDIQLLDVQRGFTFLRRLLNYAAFKEGMRLKDSGFVDFQACDSSLECHHDHLCLDDYHIQVLTLKEPPARTFAHLLDGLAEIPSNCVIASEWKRESALKVRHLIQSKRRHFHNSKTSLATSLNTTAQTSPRDVLVDDGAAALVASLGGCLEEIEVHGGYFGEFSMIIVLYNKDWSALRSSVAECFKVFAAHDAHLTEERYNLLNAWLAVLPGNTAYNLRRFWLLNTNYADLSFLFTPDPGGIRNEQLSTEYLAVLETTGGTPYFFNLHYKDVAHTLVLGATGSGKSFLLNFLLTHLQKYEPVTFIFDLGGSYESLTRLFSGSYLPVAGLQRSFTINPFCLPPTKENLQFLFSFVKVLVESSAYQMNAADDQDLFEQIGTSTRSLPTSGDS